MLDKIMASRGNINEYVKISIQTQDSHHLFTDCDSHLSSYLRGRNVVLMLLARPRPRTGAIVCNSPVSPHISLVYMAPLCPPDLTETEAVEMW